MNKKAVRDGRREVLADCPIWRVRHAGGGRRVAEDKDPGLEAAPEELIEPETAGDPQRVVKYMRSTLRQLWVRLRERGYAADPMMVRCRLKKRGHAFRLNARRKDAKASPPERDTQFAHID